MPVAIIAAGIGAVGAIGGAAIAGGAAKSAARTQADAAAQQQAAIAKTRDENVAMFAPDVASGDAASSRINDLLGLSGNKIDAGAILRSTPGYQFRVDEALKGVNSNAYASGLGNSGATQKALQARAMGLADQTFNNYYGQVTDVANRGVAAKGAVAGVSTNATNSSNQVTQNAADNQSNLTLFNAANWNNAIAGIGKAAGTVLQSSYAPGGIGAAMKNPNAWGVKGSDGIY